MVPVTPLHRHLSFSLYLLLSNPSTNFCKPFRDGFFSQICVSMFRLFVFDFGYWKLKYLSCHLSGFVWKVWYNLKNWTSFTNFSCTCRSVSIISTQCVKFLSFKPFLLTSSMEMCSRNVHQSIYLLHLVGKIPILLLDLYSLKRLLAMTFWTLSHTYSFSIIPEERSLSSAIVTQGNDQS